MKSRKKRLSTVLYLILLAIVIITAVYYIRFVRQPDNLVKTVKEISSESPLSTKSATPTVVPTEEKDEQWYLILVNNSNPLPETYKINTIELSNGQTADERVYPFLQQMFDDARKDGVYPVVGSGCRTAEYQKELMDEEISKNENEGFSHDDAVAVARTWVAPVGTSEHQSGLAYDINGDKVNSSNQEVYDWLYQNAWKYGFILRYPDGKKNITGIEYEPWHYRYVGKDAAKVIFENNMTLEEYLQ